MLLLNNKEIMKILTMDKAIECVKKAYSLYSADKVESPQRIALKNELSNGTALFMPATVKETGDTSIKIVSVYPENKKYKKETVLSTILLLDNKTGEVCSVLDGGSITQMRTGAASGVAIELLSKKDSKIGALLGTGGHAIGQLQAMLTANLDEIYIYSRNYENAVNFINKFTPILDLGNTKLIPTNNTDEAIEDADIIVTITTSNEPLFNGKKIKKGTLICGIGAYTPQMHEIDEYTMQNCEKIYVDSIEATTIESGEIIDALNKNLISIENLNEIGNLINNKISGRISDDEIIVFKSVGIAAQDTVTSNYVYNKALELGLGQTFEL